MILTHICIRKPRINKIYLILTLCYFQQNAFYENLKRLKIYFSEIKLTF